MGDDNGRVPSGSYPQQAYNGDVRVSPQPAHAIKSPPTTTDHYNHTESIWRIVVDILSLSVRKFDREVTSSSKVSMI